MSAACGRASPTTGKSAYAWPDAGCEPPVYASHAYLLKTACSRAEVEGLAGECLANGLIQHYRIFTPADIAGITPYIPKVVGEHNPSSKPLI